MATREKPTLTVTVDKDIKADLMRRKREESLNVSAHVNHLLRVAKKRRSK